MTFNYKLNDYACTIPGSLRGQLVPKLQDAATPGCVEMSNDFAPSAYSK